MNKAEVARLIGQVLILFPNAKIEASALTVDVWHMVLKDSEFDASCGKLIQYAQEGKPFAPSPGELFAKPAVKGNIPDRQETDDILQTYREANLNALRMTTEQKERATLAKRHIESIISRPTDV